MYLAEKGLTPPYTDVDLAKREHKAPDFLAMNSLGQVPTLVLDDGTVISESVAICRYFEALHPEPPLFGRSPLEQASVEMWIRRLELQLMTPVSLFWVNAHPLTAGLHSQKYKDYGEAQKRRALDRMLWAIASSSPATRFRWPTSSPRRWSTSRSSSASGCRSKPRRSARGVHASSNGRAPAPDSRP